MVNSARAPVSSIWKWAPAGRKGSAGRGGVIAVQASASSLFVTRFTRVNTQGNGQLGLASHGTAIELGLSSRA